LSQIQVIELDQAEPLARGRAYGEAARQRIRDILEVYAEQFALVTGESWEEIVDRGRVHLAPARQYAPDLIEEVTGIAQGSGRSFEEIFLLNARSEIVFGAKALGLECTSLLALPQATIGGETLLAQNWDWLSRVKGLQVMLKIAGRGEVPPLVTFTEAGQVAKIGLNGAGLGLVVNNLTSDQPRPGVPWIFIARRVLEASHLTQALGLVLSAQRAHSINFMLALAAGEGVDLETSPVEEHVLWPENGLLVHTNHFLQAGQRFRDLKPLRDAWPSTYLRLRRAGQGLAARWGRLDEAGLREVLSDHFDRPFSVCAHPNPSQEPVRRMETCLSIILNLSARRILFCPDNPCRGEWERLDLKDVWGG